MKIIPADFKKKINFLEETEYKKRCPMLGERQVMHQNLSFFNINTIQVHTMNLSDLLNVELCNDNLKMFNQVSEETFLALGNDLDEHVLDNLHERQVRTSTLMKNAVTSYQQDMVLKKGAERHQTLRTTVNDILEQQQRNSLISEEERLKRPSSSSVLFGRELKKMAKIVDLERQHACARKAEHVLLNMTRQRRGRQE